MLEDSEDPIVKTVQPTIKTSRKWKVVKVIWIHIKLDFPNMS